MSDAPPVRKRRRPAKSCEQCRKRKIKCDLEEPCGPCMKARASLACSYSVDSIRDSQPPRTEPRPSVAGREDNILDIPGAFDILGEAAVEANQSKVEDGSASKDVDLTISAALSDLRSRLARLERQSNSNDGVAPTVKDLQSRLARIERHLMTVTTEEDESGTPRLRRRPELSLPPTEPRLRVGACKTRLFGPGHWLHTAAKFQVLGSFDHEEALPPFPADGLGARMKSLRGLRHFAKKQQSVTLHDPVPDIASTLPSRQVCDELVRAYIRTFEPVFRIFHLPSFWKMYEAYWNDTDQETPVSFRMKLILVLAIGTTFYPHRSELERLQRLAHTWIYAAHWWMTGPTEKLTYNLDGLQVGCLLHLARQTNSLGASSWFSSGTLLRVALFMGLHRDPRHFPSLTPFQSEMRRRLWATILELTALPALDSSMPLGLSMDDYDAQAPSNLNDEDLNPEFNAPVRPKADGEVTDTSIQRLLLRSLPNRLRATKLINSLASPQPYEETINLGVELRSACREAAAFFQAASISEKSRDLPISSFHKEFIDMYLRRYILFLHRPFVLQGQKDPRFYLARKICKDSALVIASYANGLNLPSQELDDLSRMFITVSGTLKGPLSFDVISMLGLELLAQLEEDGAGSSTAIDPLDEMGRAARAPVKKVLEHINEQLLQLIALGVPRLKRYGFLSVLLSQVRALETGQPVKKAIYDAMRDCMDKCCAYLEAARSVSTPQDSIESLTRASTSVTDEFEDPFGFDLNDILNPGLMLNLPGVMFPSGGHNDDQFDWI